MTLGLIKLASRILLTSPKARKVAGKVIQKAYIKAKPVIKKKSWNNKNKNQKEFKWLIIRWLGVVFFR